MRHSLVTPLAAATAGAALLSALPAWAQQPANPASAPIAAMRKPNIVFILADDMGYGDLGCYGQKKIRTPNLDRMAAEGMRFTQAYSGTSVCAPSRCSLLTGLHTGHSYIRANRELPGEGQIPLPAGTFTVAGLLKDSGYATACAGKWGLGFIGTSGDPLKNGFDHFFGYNCQRQAHSYYPDHLWRDEERVPLDGKTYSHDLMTEDALQWVKAHKAGPFFLYLAYTAPHENIAVPELEPYVKELPWKPHQKTYASIVSRMDRDVGRLRALLKELGLEQNTLVIFASDNGQDGPDAKFFDSNGGLRGTKRDMYEGGFREPFIACWPGSIKAGTVEKTPIAFWDFLPTAAELADAKIPQGKTTDGVSIAGLLRGGPAPKRDYLYWELHEGRFIQALRQGDWKVVKNGPNATVELYNLADDPQEKNNLAGAQPERVATLEKLMREARTDSELWPVKAGAGAKKAKKK